MEENPNDVMIAIDLRDIHLPLDVPWWPLANGWWVLVMGLLMLISLLLYWRHTYLKQRLLRNVALRELHHLQQLSLTPFAYFNALYSLLRRISRLLPEAERYNRDDGCEWFLWLLHRSDLAECSEELKQQLKEIPYQRESQAVMAVEELEQLSIVILEKLPDIPMHPARNAALRGESHVR